MFKPDSVVERPILVLANICTVIKKFPYYGHTTPRGGSGQWWAALLHVRVVRIGATF